MWQNLFKPQFHNWRWALCFSTAIYFCLFIIFLEPFKGDALTYNIVSASQYLSTKYIIFNCLMIVLICVGSFVMLPKYYPELFLSKKFKFSCFILLSVLTILGIAIGNFFINNYFYNLEATFGWTVNFFFKIAIPGTIFIGVPFVFLFLLVFNVFTASEMDKDKQIKESDSLDLNKIQDLGSKEKETFPLQMESESLGEDKVAVEIRHFTDNSSKNTFNLPLDRIYYITSAHNYIEIFCKNEEGKITPILIRNSLKAIEEEMIIEDNSPLIRCHKAFIVNREKVIELRGSVKTAQFILKDIDNPIPVSRKKYAELEPQFVHLLSSLSKFKH